MPGLVQKNINATTVTSTTTWGVSCSAIGNGNTAFGFICQADATQTCQVKDSNAVLATMVPSTAGVVDGGFGNRAWMWYAPNVSGSPTGFTATFSVAGGAVVSISIQEWTGIATSSPLDQSRIDNVASSTVVTGTGVTPTQSGEVFFAGVVGDSNSPGTISAGTNVAWVIQNNLAADGVADESFVQGAAASTAGQFKFTTAAACQLGIMTFKAAAAAGQTPYQPYFQQMLAS